MSGAYVAKPAVPPTTVPPAPSVPDPWDPNWPFPGTPNEDWPGDLDPDPFFPAPYPPGYEPDYSLVMTATEEMKPFETALVTGSLRDYGTYATNEPTPIIWTAKIGSTVINLRFSGDSEYASSISSDCAFASYWGAAPSIEFELTEGDEGSTVVLTGTSSIDDVEISETIEISIIGVVYALSIYTEDQNEEARFPGETGSPIFVFYSCYTRHAASGYVYLTEDGAVPTLSEEELEAIEVAAAYAASDGTVATDTGTFDSTVEIEGVEYPAYYFSFYESGATAGSGEVSVAATVSEQEISTATGSTEEWVSGGEEAVLTYSLSDNLGYAGTVTYKISIHAGGFSTIYLWIKAVYTDGPSAVYSIYYQSGSTHECLVSSKSEGTTSGSFTITAKRDVLLSVITSVSVSGGLACQGGDLQLSWNGTESASITLQCRQGYCPPYATSVSRSPWIAVNSHSGEIETENP